MACGDVVVEGEDVVVVRHGLRGTVIRALVCGPRGIRSHLTPTSLPLPAHGPGDTTTRT